MAKQKINQAQSATNSYSSSEVIVGTWTNGSPIYRICLNPGAKSNYPVAHGISGLTTSSMFINIQVVVKDNGTTGWRILPWIFDVSQANWIAGVYVDATYVRFQNGGQTSGISTFDNSIIILEYIK